MDQSRPFYRAFRGSDTESTDSSDAPANHRFAAGRSRAVTRDGGVPGTSRIHTRRMGISSNGVGRRRSRRVERSNGVVGTPKTYARDPSPSDFAREGDADEAEESMYDEGRPRSTRAEELRNKGIRGEILDFPSGMVPEKKPYVHPDPPLTCQGRIRVLSPSAASESAKRLSAPKPDIDTTGLTTEEIMPTGSPHDTAARALSLSTSALGSPGFVPPVSDARKRSALAAKQSSTLGALHRSIAPSTPRSAAASQTSSSGSLPRATPATPRGRSAQPPPPTLGNNSNFYDAEKATTVMTPAGRRAPSFGAGAIQQSPRPRAGINRGVRPTPVDVGARRGRNASSTGAPPSPIQQHQQQQQQRSSPSASNLSFATVISHDNVEFIEPCADIRTPISMRDFDDELFATVTTPTR